MPSSVHSISPRRGRRPATHVTAHGGAAGALLMAAAARRMARRAATPFGIFAPQASAARARAWPNPWQPCAAGFRVPNRGLRRPKACAAEHALGCRRPHPGAAQSAGEPLATLRRQGLRARLSPRRLGGRTTLAGNRAPADLALRCSTARLIFACMCIDMCACAWCMRRDRSLRSVHAVLWLGQCCQ